MSKSEAAQLLNMMAPLLKVRPVIDDYCRLAGAWASHHAPNGQGCAQFHIVTRGTCIIERSGLETLKLTTGDILLLPHGDSHIVRSQGSHVMRPISDTYRNGIRQRITHQAEPEIELLCGRLYFEISAGNPLIAVLPDEIIIKTGEQPILERFRYLLTEIRNELEGSRAGSEMIAADLARALFIMMLRSHFEDTWDNDGMNSLLQHPVTSRVVLALLNDLAREWTLDDMATVAIASRATLVRAFRKYADIAPMTFLADLRLATARQRLAGTSDAIAEIAAAVGYASEGALSKAIMRKFGVRPGAIRLTGTS